MSKQEEIREGIQTILWQMDFSLLLSMYHKRNYDGGAGYDKMRPHINAIADKLFNYLHSQGVVIKVDTSNWVNHTVTVSEGLNSATFPARLLKDAGYVPVVSLVEPAVEPLVVSETEPLI